MEPKDEREKFKYFVISFQIPKKLLKLSNKCRPRNFNSRVLFSPQI